jgi:hypothetical protein
MCRAICDAVTQDITDTLCPGLDLTEEIRAAQAQRLGDMAWSFKLAGAARAGHPDIVVTSTPFIHS